jgi:hypothetical protein
MLQIDLYIDYENITPDPDLLSKFLDADNTKAFFFLRNGLGVNPRIKKIINNYPDKTKIINPHVNGKNASDHIITFHMGLEVSKKEYNKILYIMTKDLAFKTFADYVNNNYNSKIITISSLDQIRDKFELSHLIVSNKDFSTVDNNKIKQQKYFTVFMKILITIQHKVNLPITHKSFKNYVTSTFNDKNTTFNFEDLYNFMLNNKFLRETPNNKIMFNLDISQPQKLFKLLKIMMNDLPIIMTTNDFKLYLQKKFNSIISDKMFNELIVYLEDKCYLKKIFKKSILINTNGINLSSKL